MKKLSLQFHALPSEIVSLLESWEGSERLFVFGQNKLGSAFEKVKFGTAELRSSIGHYKSLTIMYRQAKLGANTVYDFVKDNPGTLTIELGNFSDQELTGSWMAAMSDDKVTMDRWRQLAGHFRKSMKTGADARNPASGDTDIARGHYFSSGAAEFYRNGGKLLLWPGKNLLEIPLRN